MSVVELKKKSLKLENLFLYSNKLEEINRLESELGHAKSKLRLLAIELKQIEQDINKILDEHYSFVGELYKDEDKKFISIPKIANLNILNKIEFNESDSINDIINKLYKKLSKMCYPEKHVNSNVDQFFSSINEAYNEKNLQELLTIEEYLSGENKLAGESPQEKLIRLSDEYDQVLDKIKDLKNTKEEINSTHEFEFKRQVLWAKMRGEDLISKIKSDIYKQLQKTKTDN